MLRLLKRLICKIKGHSYRGLDHGFMSNCLYFCDRCGKELLDRTFEDLEPMTEEEREYFEREVLF